MDNILIFILIYLFYGILNILLNKNLNKIYIGILLFFLFKTIFNYRKCTISYLECKLRKVKKEQGYLNRFMDKIIDIRYSNISIILYIYSFLIIYYYFIEKRNSINL